MLHPLRPNEPEIEATLDICILWKGVPHGLAIIQYKDPENSWYSFRGIGVFNRGQLHDAPFIFIHSYGQGEDYENGYLFSKMQNGRPGDGYFSTYFKYKKST